MNHQSAFTQYIQNRHVCNRIADVLKFPNMEKNTVQAFKFPYSENEAEMEQCYRIRELKSQGYQVQFISSKVILVSKTEH
jgi:hypothetical protein